MSSKQGQPKISVIIPVLHLRRPSNPKRFFMPQYSIIEVLNDLKKQKNENLSLEIIVICNGQQEELTQLIRTQTVIDKYVLNSINVGVARSWNMGAQLAEGEALCFLNDDVSVGPGSLRTLYDQLFSSEPIAQVGPKGAIWKGAQHDRFVGVERVEDADAIAGYCFMLKTEPFRRLGGFDVAYSPAGFEEIDFSFTLRKAGYRCLVVPHLNIHHYHHHGVSAYKTQINYLSTSIDTETLHQRNKKYFCNKWGLVDVD